MKHAHLWKRILNEGLKSLSPTTRPEDLERVQNLIVSSPFIFDPRPIDLRPQRESTETYSGLCPPFPRFFVESVGATGGNHVGCLVSADKEPDGSHVLRCLGILVGKHGPTVCGNFTVALIEGRIHERQMEAAPETIANLGSPEKTKAVIAGISVIAFDVMELLACSNVALDAHPIDPKEARRAAKRLGGDPSYYRYHVLVVRPAGSKPGTKGEEIGIMPRHVCRQHFAYYGPEFGKGLLFGKYAGKFLIPPHVRGDKKNGVVAKDYALPSRPPSPTDLPGGTHEE